MPSTCIHNIKLEVQDAIFVVKPINWLVISGMHGTVDKIMASIWRHLLIHFHSLVALLLLNNRKAKLGLKRPLFTLHWKIKSALDFFCARIYIKTLACINICDVMLIREWHLIFCLIQCCFIIASGNEYNSETTHRVGINQTVGTNQNILHFGSTVDNVTDQDKLIKWTV